MTRINTFQTVSTTESNADTGLEHLPQGFAPAQWHQAIGIARQACARIFRDGGSPSDALKVFGIATQANQPHATTIDWSKAVAAIAESLSAAPQRRAA